MISGKGGTGKTTITGALAALAGRTARSSPPDRPSPTVRGPVFVDADVDAADLGLILRPTVKESHEFFGARQAVIEASQCTGCGRCSQVCRRDAICGRDGLLTVDALLCEGCGVCSHVCPAGAVRMKAVVSGSWFVSDTPHGPLVHASLEPGGDNSGKLVTQVRRAAREIASARGSDLILIDGPPGIGCPVMASLTGVTAALVVTEPTLTAVHDLERVLAVCGTFRVPVLAVINRCNLDESNASLVERRCAELGVEVVASIPYDQDVTRAMVRGLTVVEYAGKDGVERAGRNAGGRASSHIERLWERLLAFADAASRTPQEPAPQARMSSRAGAET